MRAETGVVKGSTAKVDVLGPVGNRRSDFPQYHFRVTDALSGDYREFWLSDYAVMTCDLVVRSILQNFREQAQERSLLASYGLDA